MATAGLRITIPGAKFSRNVGQVAYPITDHLEGLFYLGGDAASSARNHAPGKTDGVVIGMPSAYQPGYIHFVGNLCYLQTPVFDTTNDITIISVVRSLENPGRVISNNGGYAGAAEIILYPTGYLAFVSLSQGAANQDILSAPQNVATKFTMVAAVIRGSSKSITISQEGALVTSENTPGARVLTGVRSFAIGGAVPGVPDVPGMIQDVGATAIHSKALSALEIQNVYSYLRQRYARLGISI